VIGFVLAKVTVAPVAGAPELSTSLRITARRAPLPAVRHDDVTVRPLAALTDRVLHEQAALVLEQVQTRQALPPVQSRGEPPVHEPEPLHVCPTVQNSGLQAVPGDCGEYWQVLLGEQLAPVSHSGIAEVQSLQLPPPLPQAVAPSPATQLPPLQQPLHAPAEQAPPATHCEPLVAQTAPVGQSPAPVQPHLPLTHAAPDGLPVQGPQAAPLVPHDRLPCDA
jgi:hypothetical protein